MMIKVRLYSNIEPYRWQENAHKYVSYMLSKPKDDPEKILIIKAARQIYGKSCFDKAELLRFSLQFKNNVNGYIAPSYSLSKKMYKEIVKCSRPLIVRKNEQDMEITFKTGSVIKFFSAEQRDNLRGFTITGVLIIDEASFIANDVYHELISPWTRVHNAITILSSTPKYKNGFFYDMYSRGLSGSETYKTLDWIEEFPPNEDDPFLIEKKLITPRLKYQSEYLGQFIDAEGSVFGSFKHILIPEIEGIAEGDELFVGIDWATGIGKDYTALSILNSRGEQVELQYWNDKTPESQFKIIAETLIELKIGFNAVIKKVYAEKNSMGDTYLKMLQNKVKRYGITITPFWTGEDSKRELIEQFQVAIEQSLIWLVDEKEQVDQLQSFEGKLSKNTNKLKYGAMNGKHDDIVIADMLAYKALRDRNKVYTANNISVI